MQYEYNVGEVFEIALGEIIYDYLPYKYAQKVKNSLQYKEFIGEFARQGAEFIDKL